MLDDVISGRVEMIWGFAVPTLPNGRRQWPTELRDMVLQKIAAGAGIRETAEEIGAHQSLVHRWVRRARGAEEPLTFIEITPSRKKKEKALPISTPVQADQSGGGAVCHIRLNDCDITVPSGYFAAHLAAILRAMRAAA